MGLVKPRTNVDELYTYKRVMENGEWVMRRVPVKQGDVLASGAPVFSKYAPEYRSGEHPGAYSSMMEHLLGRLPVTTTDNTSEPLPQVFIVRSESIHGLTPVLLPRLQAYKERGFSWIIEASESNGPSNVTLSNVKTGQAFTFYFDKQEQLAMWATGVQLKPRRIVRRFFKASGMEEEDVNVPEVDDVVDFIITGGKPGEVDEKLEFGRLVELD